MRATPHSPSKFRFFVLALLWSATVHAHGDVHVRIDRIGEQLRQRPDAALFIERGQLHELDENWQAAITDYRSARAQTPENGELDYFEARALLRLANPRLALEKLQHYLRSSPHRSDAWVLVGRSYAALEQGAQAADAYDRAIATASAQIPELYVERAQVLLSMDPPRVNQALSGLREGVARLGAVVTLIEPAVDAEERRGEFLAAIAWAERLPPVLRQSPLWRLRVGRLHARAGNTTRAEREFRAGLAFIAQLPPVRARSEVHQQTQRELQTALQRLHRTAAPAPSSRPTSNARYSAMAVVVVLLALFALYKQRTSAPQS